MPILKSLKQFWNSTVAQYETNSIIKYDTKSRTMRKLGIFKTGLQVIAILVIPIVLVLTKSYQEYSDIAGSVSIKLKGVAITNFSDSEFQVDNPDSYRRVWDISQTNHLENGAFLVMTNVIITPNQTRNGICAEDYTLPEAVCDPLYPHKTCTKGKVTTSGYGVMTGKCIPSLNPNIHTCEIIAWCPLEYNKLPLGPDRALLAESKHFTVFIKNDIEFYEFNITRSNVKTTEDIKSCIYNSETHQFCPIFKLNTIVTEAGQDYDKMAIQGGIIAIYIIWKCDHMRLYLESCIPTYRFQRLDRSIQNWNFKYPSYHSETSRTLYKIYGIRFVVIVQGQGGRFHIQPTLLSFGSYLGYVGLAAIICDLVLTIPCSERLKHYNKLRYTSVTATSTSELQGNPQAAKETVHESIPTDVVHNKRDDDSQEQTTVQHFGVQYT